MLKGIKLTNSQLKILKLAARPEGCSQFMRYILPTVDILRHRYGFIKTDESPKTRPIYRATAAGLEQLKIEAARPTRQRRQPITEAIDSQPDGRDFGGGADF